MSEKLDLDKNQTPSTQEPLSDWKHGWYVFEDGQVSGPLDAKDALAQEKSSTGQTIRMVSRKGFTQWYPVRDFAEIYGMIEAYSRRIDVLPVSENSVASTFMPKSKIISTNASDGLKNANSSATLVGENIHRQDTVLDPGVQVQPVRDVLESSSESSIEPSSELREDVVTARRSPTIPRNAASESQDLVYEADGSPANNKKLKKLLRRQIRQSQAAARNQKLMAPKVFAERYFELQNRLRLGRVFSPAVGAFIYTPLTLGGYWWDWFVKASDEVAWHLTGSVRAKMALPLWFCMIPGLHLLVAYKLARAVRDMEMQNGYRSTSPFMAMLAAVFPPFYILMIQSALNKHWRLHVYHSNAQG